MKKTLLSLLFCVCTLTFIQSNTIYVRETGSNSAPADGTIDAPFKSVNRALQSVAISGDTIDVYGTTYAELNDAYNTVISLNAKSVTIIGHGQNNTFIQPAPTKELSTNRVFSLSNGAKLMMKNLTVRWGTTSGTNGVGGNITVWESGLELENVTITEGYAQKGGAIAINGSNGDTIMIKDCNISNNQSTTYGAGIYTGSTSTQGTNMEIHTTLISNNKLLNSTATGAGIYIDGYANSVNPCNYAIYNSTIAFNETPYLGAGIGTQWQSAPATKITLINNTIAYNKANATTKDGPGGLQLMELPNLSLDVVNNLFINNIGRSGGVAGSVYDAGFKGPTLLRVQHNIFTNTLPQWYIEHPTNAQPNADPAATNIYKNNSFVLLADSLDNNGGPTPTISVSTGSVAINAGLSITGSPYLLYDQRGYERYQQVDIGAYEFDGITTAWKDEPYQMSNFAYYDKANNTIVLNKEDKYTVEIFDANGVRLTTHNINDSDLSVAALASQKIYLAVVRNESGKTSVIKFIR